MADQDILYTVIAGKRSHLVKYAIGPAYIVKLFSGGFLDPGEASQTFKAKVPGDHEYLKEKAFERRVEDLSSLHQQDLQRLAEWNNGKKVCI